MYEYPCSVFIDVYSVLFLFCLTCAPTGAMGSNTNNKTPRETDTPNTTSDSQCNKKQKQKHSHRECDSQSSVSSCIYVDFKCLTININGFSEEKWKYILSPPGILSVSVIILTEHHLSATFRPKELIDSGWNIRAVAGIPKRRSKQHQHRGGVAILYRSASNLKIEQHRITDGSNGSSHQTVSWTIHSPLLVDPIHITGVYVSPSEGEVEEFSIRSPNRTITPIVKLTCTPVILMRMWAKNLKFTSPYKNDPPFHLELVIVTGGTYPRHQMHLPLQMQEHPPSSGVAS